jgi:hypothetical protein
MSIFWQYNRLHRLFTTILDVVGMVKMDYCPQNCTAIIIWAKKYTAKKYSWSKKVAFQKKSMQ